MSYNTTQIDNVTSLGDWYVNINDAANGYPAIAILVLLWIGIYVFVTNRNLPPSESVMASSFVCSVISGFLLFQGLIPTSIVVIFVTLTMVGVIIRSFS